MLSTPKPFDFQKLPRVSREEARWVNALYRYLPPGTFAAGLQRSLQELLTGELGVDCSFKLERVMTVEAASYLETLPKQGVYLAIGLAPLDEKAICEMDLLLSHSIIDRLLGGEGEPLSSPRPLTEIEEGVLSYLWLKLLSRIYEEAGGSARVHFRLHQCCSSPQDFKLSLGTKAIVLSFRIRIGDKAGYARLLFPSPFAQKVFLEPMTDFTAAEAVFYRQRLDQFGFIGTHIWAEVGRTTLRQQELQGVKEGDILVLEETGARLQGGKVSGQLTLRIGNGELNVLRGPVLPVDGDKIKMKLEEISWEHPLETSR